MKKLLVVAAMLAMVLVAASPAFAQASAGNISIQAVDASQTQASMVTQSAVAVGGTGNANGAASAVDNSAYVDQSASVDQVQVNGGLGGVWIWWSW